MDERQININFDRKLGRLKPVSGARVPCSLLLADKPSFTEIISELGVPVAYVGGDPPGELSLSELFPDPGLDERFFASYNFAAADAALSALSGAGARIFLALTDRVDPHGMRRNLISQVSPERLAVIIEKIILHYNRGWGGGMKLGIKYVELFSGMDRRQDLGCEEQFSLYCAVATHLKAKFPTLKVGAYSSGGFRAENNFDATEKERGYPEYLDRFLRYITSPEHTAPLDFLSWECPADYPEELLLHSNYARAALTQYGLRRTESIISGFSLRERKKGLRHISKEYPAELASAFIAAQKSEVGMLIYDSLGASDPKNGIFSVDDRVSVHRYAAYALMSAVGGMYPLSDRVETTEDFRRELYTLAASDGERGAVLIVTREFSGTVVLSPSGADFNYYSISGTVGGGVRGEGRTVGRSDIPLRGGKISLSVGKNEVYLVTFS